jgi:hypothetical protein
VRDSTIYFLSSSNLLRHTCLSSQVKHSAVLFSSLFAAAISHPKRGGSFPPSPSSRRPPPLFTSRTVSRPYHTHTRQPHPGHPPSIPPSVDCYILLASTLAMYLTTLSLLSTAAGTTASPVRCSCSPLPPFSSMSDVIVVLYITSHYHSIDI